MVRWSTIAVCLAIPPLAVAGGFSLTTYSPGAPIAAHVKDAVVVVSAEGCHNPAEARLTATAEGLVAGKRRSVPLKLAGTSRAGAYVVTREWPAEGVWVVNVRAEYQGRTTGGLIPVGRDGRAGKLAMQPFGRPVPQADVDAALSRLAGT